MAGASPDGLVGKFGLLELKCPARHTHLEYLRKGTIDPAYHAQMTFQIACTGREWVDWVSYCPALPEQEMITLATGAQTNCRLITGRFVPSLDDIFTLEEHVCRFLEEVDAGVIAVQSKWGDKWIAP